MIIMMNSLLIDLFKVIYILYLMQRTYDLIIVRGQVFIISFQTDLNVYTLPCSILSHFPKNQHRPVLV